MYDKDVKTVDGEDIDDEYRPGTGTHPCPSCGETCEINHNILEFSEFIYCESCRMKFVRSRDPVFENDYKGKAKSIVQVSKEEKDGYIEFRCFECDTNAIDEDYRIHEKTVPSGEFEPVETGINGYDECNLTCPCGNRHNAYIDIGEVIDCECGRTYKLSVDE